MAAEGCYLHEDDITWPAGYAGDKQAVIDKVEQIIDKVTGTHWCPTAFDIKLNGNNKNRLFIPLETDILSVTGIFINCVELDSNWWTYDINSVFLDPCIGDSMWGRNAIQDGDFYNWKVADPTTDLYYWVETPTWEVDFDGGQNEPAIGDDVGTATDDNFFITAYQLTGGAWDGTGVGKLWLRKPGFTTCGWADNEQINNNTQGNILANGGAGLGVNGAVADASTVNRDSDEVQVGNYCVRLDIDAVPSQAGISQKFSLYHNRNYRLFFKYLNSIAGATAEFLLYNADKDESLAADGTWVAGQVYVELANVLAWTDYSLDFTSHADFANYELYLGNWAAASSEIYFDNVGVLTAGIAAIASDLTEGIFPHGFNNVQVVGTHGESSIPEAIKQAGIILANWEVDPAAEAAAGLMKSEKIGDYSYTNLATAEVDVLTGVNKADMLLRHYIKRKAILMAP